MLSPTIKVKKGTFRCFAAAGLAAFLILAAGSPEAFARSKGTRVHVYESSESLKESLASKTPITFQATATAKFVVRIDDKQKFQEMDGFGASLTESSAWLLAKKLSPEQRKELLIKLFDPRKGIGLNILREPIGSSDFAVKDDYSLDDMAEGQSDPDLRNFSIVRDREFIIPVLREALKVNHEIKIIGSPWSAPGWMKTSHSMIGGTLLPSAYGPLARYFVQFVKQYEAAGVPIFAITPQNEPLNIPKDYPGMGMSAEEQTTFVRDNLGPAFREAHLKTKIMIFDHNWDLMAFPKTVLSDPKTAAFVAGTATHCYGGNADAQTQLHSQFPDKEIWLTECSGGDWQKGDLLVSQAKLIIQTTGNWAKSVILWNLALDQTHGPHVGGCYDCRGVVTIDDSTSPSKVTPTVDFTALSHASKFVFPGAHHIGSTGAEQTGLEHVAFRNKDGSIVLLALNTGAEAISFDIESDGEFAGYTLESGAVATFVWQGKADHNALTRAFEILFMVA